VSLVWKFCSRRGAPGAESYNTSITKINKCDFMTKVEFTIPIHSVTDTIRKEAENKAKEAYVMTLLKHGEISSGKASQLLGVSRLDMIELMSKYDISLFDDSMSLEEFQSEINQARMGLKANNL
jgi:predicted HTH domain antitoxin